MSTLPMPYIRAIQDFLLKQGSIIGIDPGESTGIVLLGTGMNTVIGTTLGLNQLYDWVVEDPLSSIARIIMEDYLLYPGAATAGRQNFNRVYSARAIGAIEVLSRQHQCEIIYQTANEGKTAVSDDLLKTLYGTYITLMTKHEKDALRHVVCWASKEITKAQPPIPKF